MFGFYAGNIKKHLYEDTDYDRIRGRWVIENGSRFCIFLIMKFIDAQIKFITDIIIQVQDCIF